MRRSFILTALAALLALSGTARAERIRSFVTEIQVDTEGQLRVTEKIAYDFESAERHGIFRVIPVRYERPGADFRVALDVESVTDAAGRALPYRTGRAGRDLEVRIGDPDRTVTGLRDYWITYRVRRAMLYFEDHDELYWNATGTAWPVPIDRAETVVFVPEGVDPGALRAACYTGPAGSRLSECREEIRPRTVAWNLTRPLGPREGLTVVLGLPKGLVREPSGFEQLRDRVSDYLSGWMLLPLATFAFMYHRWRTQGRDPAGRAAIEPRYAPPEGLSPAEVGTLLDERADIGDLSATILDLAVRGYLTIEETEAKKFLFFSNKDYVLHDLHKPVEGLKEHERIFYRKLFRSGDSVRISELRNSFYKYIDEIREHVYTALAGPQGYFPVRPDKVRTLYRVFGAGTAGVGVLGFGAVGSALGWTLAAPICIALSGLLVVLFAPAMPRRTQRGRQAYEEIVGFKEFVGRVDADRLERTGGRTADAFEKVLPYAMVLGVADQWADAFADIYTSPPKWYAGTGGPHFYPRTFVGDLGRALTTMNQAMTSQPSSGSGGSGFSGGSSGGGFGGGGGGSW